MTIRIASAFRILSRRRRRGGYPAVPSSRRRAIGCSKLRFIDDGLPVGGGAAARPSPGHAGILISPRRELTGIGRSAKGKGHAGPDLPQPALQHLAQDAGLVRDKGVEPEIVEYLNTPYTAALLKTLLGQLKMPARALIRKKEAAEAGIDPAKLSNEQLIAAMAKHPIIVERPIVVSGNKAALGRPPEKVLEVL